MSMISVGEADFDAVAHAAADAERRGDRAAARTLDKLARKISSALSTTNAKRAAGPLAHILPHKPFTWRDVPSVLQEKDR